MLYLLETWPKRQLRSLVLQWRDLGVRMELLSIDRR